MCFSERESWLTLAASLSGCSALALTRGPAWGAVAAFLASAGSMQLWEALLWRQQPWCTDANVLFSKLGAVTNHAEPLVYLLACMALLNPVSKSLSNAAIATGLVYAVVFGALTYSFVNRPKHAQCTLDEGNGLVWKWNDHGRATTPSYALFIASLLLTTYAYLPPGMNHMVWTTTCVSFAFSYMIYGKARMIGSMWCFYAALLPWFFVAVT